jgi:ferredoxin, 2Fe-2S
MPKVIFIQPNGERVVVENAAGTLMEIALDHDVEGITGDCGGVCSCSTCHVYIPPEWQSLVGAAEVMELDTLSFNDHKKPNSRLCCQVEMTEALNGLVVEVAPKE